MIFDSIFVIIAEWKTRFFIKKKWRKARVFIAFCAFFRDFWKIEKFLQVQIFFHIFMVAACKYKGELETTPEFTPE